MKINQQTRIVGSKVILVPYRKSHVDQYNKWMQNEELQAMTSSEPLTSEEEYEMQQKWADDEDKCTFIVLDATLADDSDERIGMIGDVNLFIDHKENTAECEVMIAEEKARRQGMAREAMSLMIGYGIDALKIEHFFAVISEENTGSIALFKKLGFLQSNYMAVFKQIKFELSKNRFVDFTDALRQARITSIKL